MSQLDHAYIDVWLLILLFRGLQSFTADLVISKIPYRFEKNANIQGTTVSRIVPRDHAQVKTSTTKFFSKEFSYESTPVEEECRSRSHN